MGIKIGTETGLVGSKCPQYSYILTDSVLKVGPKRHNHHAYNNIDLTQVSNSPIQLIFTKTRNLILMHYQCKKVLHRYPIIYCHISKSVYSTIHYLISLTNRNM